jgi:hypothetical protein
MLSVKCEVLNCVFLSFIYLLLTATEGGNTSNAGAIASAHLTLHSQSNA